MNCPVTPLLPEESFILHFHEYTMGSLKPELNASPTPPIMFFQGYFLCFQRRRAVTEYLIILTATMGVFKSLLIEPSRKKPHLQQGQLPW